MFYLVVTCNIIIQSACLMACSDVTIASTPNQSTRGAKSAVIFRMVTVTPLHHSPPTADYFPDPEIKAEQTLFSVADRKRISCSVVCSLFFSFFCRTQTDSDISAAIEACSQEVCIKSFFPLLLFAAMIAVN